jgi:predicted PurR-regulated permease PerM
MAEDVAQGRARVPREPRNGGTAALRGHARTRDDTAARTLRVVGWIVAAAAAAAALWVARTVVVLGFLGVLLAVIFSFPVGWLARFVPRGVATILVLAALVGAGAGIGTLVAPTLSREAAQLRESVPRVVRDVRQRIERVQEQAGVSAAPNGSSAQPSQSRDAIAQAGTKAVAAVAEIVAGLSEAILVVVLAAFLVHRPDLYRGGLRRLVPSAHEPTFDEAWARMRDGLRRWVGGILVSMLIMGTLTALGLLAVGIDDWLLLGVLTFLGTFVPYLGAVASAVPGLLVALGQSPRHFVLALAVYVGVHVVEGYVVEPLVMRRAVELKPALLLFGQGVFGAAFGALGFVVATPAIVCGQILLGFLWVERRLGKHDA